MTRVRAALILSVLLNLILGVLFFTATGDRNRGEPVPPGNVVVQNNESSPIIKTNVVVRRLNFIWSQIETNDYRAYIENLRMIACPEATIRDIILADVNMLYEQKRLMEVVTPEQQWWRSNPDGTVAQAAMQQAHSLEIERRALLDELLGPQWEKSSNWEVVAFNARFDGPVLGALSAESKEALRIAEMQGSQRRVDYLAERQAAGEPADPAELARLQRETRTELSKILNPEQVEEYLLRYSDVAQTLRKDLQGFEVSADEFRNIFRARGELELQTSDGLTGTDPVSLQYKQDLVNQQNASLEEALGSERYRLYQFSQDPLFREAQASAQEMGVDAEVVLPIYEINQATELERQRIQSDSGLTSAEQAAALAQAVEKQTESLREILGTEAYEHYRQRSVPSVPGGK